MTTDNAFEKWFTGEDDTKSRRAMMEKDANVFYKYQSAYNAFNAWQAAKSDSAKEIAELKKLSSELISTNAGLKNRIDELQAHINVLQSLLTDARDDVASEVEQARLLLPYKPQRYEYYVKQLAEIDEALSTTPAQSLTAYRNAVIEECAYICDLMVT